MVTPLSYSLRDFFLCPRKEKLNNRTLTYSSVTTRCHLLSCMPATVPQPTKAFLIRVGPT